MMQELVTALRHVSPQGGNPRGHGRGRGRYVECWNCGEPGHVRARWPRLVASSMYYHHRPFGQCVRCHETHGVSRNEANGIVAMSVGANWPIDVEKSHVVHAEAKIAGHRLTCLVDTGAGVSLVPKTIAEQFSPCSKPLVLKMANGDRLAALGEASLAVEIGELKTKHRFVELTYPLELLYLGLIFLLVTASTSC